MATFLFTYYVKDEYTAKKMGMLAKKLGKKLKKSVLFDWQWVKKGGKSKIACDFYIE